MFLVAEPPTGTELEFSGIGAALERAHQRGEQVVIAGIQIIENRARKVIISIEGIEKIDETAGDWEIVNTIDAGIGAQRVENAGRGVSEGAIVELPSPSCVGIHVTAFDESTEAERVDFCGGSAAAGADLTENAI